jgi:hypothetical protein
VSFIEGRVNSEGSIILITPHINQDAEPVARSPAARSRTRECRINKHRLFEAQFLNRSKIVVRIAVVATQEHGHLRPSIPARNLATNRAQKLFDLGCVTRCRTYVEIRLKRLDRFSEPIGLHAKDSQIA